MKTEEQVAAVVDRHGANGTISVAVYITTH